MRILQHLPAPREGELGATAVEYALFLALIAAVIIGAVVIFGGHVGELFDSVVGKF